MNSLLSAIDLPTATNGQLAEALKNEQNDSLRIKIREEIDRRVKAKALAADTPFNPRTEISADARYLWKQVFIWFWIIPAIAALLVWIVSR